MPMRHKDPSHYGASTIRSINPFPQFLNCERCGIEIPNSATRSTKLCKDCKSDRLFNPRPAPKKEESSGAASDL